MTDLIGDIGGTNARFALVDNGAVYEIETLQGSDFSTFRDAIESYLKMVGKPRIHTAAFAFAGPITGDHAQLTNRLPWSFSIEELRRAMGFERLTVVNDFYANALSLSALESNDLHKIGAGEPVAKQHKVVLGPGSGLGVAVVAWTGSTWLPLAGEGPHAKLPAGQTPREDAIIARMRERFGYVTNEHALSGRGLTHLYEAIQYLDGIAGDVPEQHLITTAAHQNTDPIAVEVVSLFLSMLGVVAGGLALTAMTKGGVYIAGGIVPQMIAEIETSRFRECFVGNSKMKPILELIPTYIITNEHPAFVGLLRLLPSKRSSAG